MIKHEHTLWINEEKRRYYRIRVQKDLFGRLVVIRTWGSLQSDRSGIRINHVDKETVDELLKSITQRRRTNGYYVVDRQNTSSASSVIVAT